MVRQKSVVILKFIEFLAQEVTSVDLKNKKVTIDDGKDTLPYDKLIIASGATPRRLPVEGANLDNVYTFRGIPDSQKVDAGKSHAAICVVQ